MEKCSASTTPGSKKPPIKASPLNKEQHSQYRTTVGQLLGHGGLRSSRARVLANTTPKLLILIYVGNMMRKINAT
eukprot:3433445-Amphidinium_carterae.2